MEVVVEVVVQKAEDMVAATVVVATVAAMVVVATVEECRVVAEELVVDL